jgi:CRISPR-associated protein Cas5a/b/c
MGITAFIVDVEFVWGFQARVVGLSKTSPSFYYPPPTTFLGALSESISKKLEIGESAGRKIIKILSNNLLALGVRPLNCIPLKYEDINKIISVKITSGVLYPNPKDLAKSYDSPARGKTIMASIDDDSPIIRFFIVLKNDSIVFEDKNVRMSTDYFWGVHRLGSKESRVSVINVAKQENIDALKGRTTSKYSFPLIGGIKPLYELQKEWLYEMYINPKEISYTDKENPTLAYIEGASLVKFMIPVLVTKYEQPEFVVEVENPAAFYKIGDETVIGWVK